MPRKPQPIHDRPRLPSVDELVRKTALDITSSVYIHTDKDFGFDSSAFELDVTCLLLKLLQESK